MFASNRTGDFDLYAARSGASGLEVEPLTSLNSLGDDREPCIDPSGRMLYGRHAPSRLLLNAILRLSVDHAG